MLSRTLCWSICCADVGGRRVVAGERGAAGVLDHENDSHKIANILISDLGVRQDFIKNCEELH